MRELSLTIFIILIFTACSANYQSLNLDEKNIFDKSIYKLSELISNLSKNIDKNEAKNVSSEAITYSKYLANKYEVIRPAIFHNTLINLNFKERGYCYHYANDLMAYLQEKDFKSFHFIKAVANKGQYFEHTSIVLTREDTSFYNSIILDAWRDSGKLFFTKVKDDTKYEWEVK